ncbi:MAG: site-specific integrase [Deltaproteobacteria bacterium]|nr:site-specific integrase [Deltaproteobacteria bacterium]
MTPDGRRVRVTGTPAVDTKRAAEDAERAHIERVLHPERVAARAAEDAPQRKELPTISEFADRFMKEYLPRQKPSERYSKERILRGKRGLLAHFGELRLDEVDQSHVNSYVAAMGSGVSAKTISNKLTVLSTLLGYAGPDGCRLIPRTDLRFVVEGMSPEIVAVPYGDVTKLVDAARDDRYRAAILLAAEAGLRIGEIRGLHWTDVVDGWITIRRSVDQRNNEGSPKHDKRRKVPVSPRLAAALGALPRAGLYVACTLGRGGRLAGQALDYWSMLEALHATYARAGVPVPASDSGETRPWHSLRHTFGTELAARGVPIPTIKELMGHADVATTMRYVTVSAPQMLEAIAAFGPGRQPVGNSSGEAGRGT